MTEHPGEESDQLPEEGPPGQVVEDTGGKRDEAQRSPGGAGDEGRGTGHPDQSREDEGPEEGP